MNALTTRQLSVGYDRHIVVPELSVTLPTGRFTAIVGANGCGKSTLLKALARLLRPLAGEVLLNGTDVREFPSRQLAQRLSILLQSASAPEALTVRELVSYGRYPHGRWLRNNHPDDVQVIQWAMEVTRISEFAERPVNSLSGGQQQRVWIAMTLSQGAKILLLDEPTNHLDMSHQLEIMELLLTLNQREQRSVVMVMHDLNLAARYSEHLIVMREGTILVQGPPADVMTEETIRQAFGVDAHVTTDPRNGRPHCVTYPLSEVRT